ncbi:MAG TPA: alpha/beta hydrolase-fold protein, partial [bacterium]|nr:alpha/beta hydrolase-fold protein [bacterium]
PVLVVGVLNLGGAGRHRDFTPPFIHRSDDAGSPLGAADRFTAFLRDELLPWVSDHYRATDARFLLGWSRGGLYAVWSLTGDPDLFDGRIALSPSLFRDDTAMRPHLDAFLREHPGLESRLYLALGRDENDNLKTAFRSVVEGLRELAPPGLEWSSELLSGVDHQAMVYEGTPRGLKAVLATASVEAAPAPFHSYPDWSPGGDSIVFSSDRSGDPELWLVGADGTGLRRLTHRPGVDSHPAWSPDGSRIAFDADLDGDREVCVLELGSGTVRRLTTSPGWDGTPAWSPDGERLVFYSERTGNAELFAMTRDGDDLRRLTETDGDEYRPSWSPDGASLLFEYAVDGERDICRLDAKGGTRTNLTSHAARDHLPAWSPDGRAILFSTRRDGNDELYVMAADGSEPTNLTCDPGADVMGRWSPDGTRIVFVSDRSGSFRIHAMEASGANVVDLEASADQDAAPASPRNLDR